MKTVVLDENKRYTYADYYSWWDDNRRELYDGFVKLIPPVNTYHQKISGALLMSFFELQKNGCQVYMAPFDVRFPENGKKEDINIYNVVQPDMSVFCSNDKIDERGGIGAPDFVIEISSRNTRKKDETDKFLLYEKFGVKEYWIANPTDQNIRVFLLNTDNKFVLQETYVEGESLSPSMFPDLVIEINDIFEF